MQSAESTGTLVWLPSATQAVTDSNNKPDSACIDSFLALSEAMK